MKSLISKQVERFLREQKNYKRWLAVFVCLAVVVTIGTTAALKYKGIAVSSDDPVTDEMHMEETTEQEVAEQEPEIIYKDGKQYIHHVHTEACYAEQPVLICEEGKAEAEAEKTEEIGSAEDSENKGATSSSGDSENKGTASSSGDSGNKGTESNSGNSENKETTGGHHHDDSCYEVTGGTETLTCTKDEHTHGDGCYETKTVTETVTKTVPKTVTKEVKDEEGNVTKVEETVDETVEETVEKEERVLTCTKEEHSHGSDCYEVKGGERKLVCGKEEGEGAEAATAAETESEPVAEAAPAAEATSEPAKEEAPAEETSDTEKATEAPAADTASEPATEETPATSTSETADESATENKETAETPATEGEASTDTEDESAENTDTTVEGEHIHTEECYEPQMVLVCNMEEGDLEEIPFEGGVQECVTGNIKVIAEYGPEACIPNNAELKVEEITEEDNPEYYAEHEAEYLEEAGEDAVMDMLLDIGFYVDDEEIEPNKDATVSITIQMLDDQYEEGEQLNVVHFGKEQTKKLEASDVETDEDGNKSTSFETDSFSVYAIGTQKLPVADLEDGKKYMVYCTDNDGKTYALVHKDERPSGRDNWHLLKFGVIEISLENGHLAFIPDGYTVGDFQWTYSKNEGLKYYCESQDDDYYLNFSGDNGPWELYNYAHGETEGARHTVTLSDGIKIHYNNMYLNYSNDSNGQNDPAPVSVGYNDSGSTDWTFTKMFPDKYTIRYWENRNSITSFQDEPIRESDPLGTMEASVETDEKGNPYVTIPVTGNVTAKDGTEVSIGKLDDLDGGYIFYGWSAKSNANYKWNPEYSIYCGENFEINGVTVPTYAPEGFTVDAGTDEYIDVYATWAKPTSSGDNSYYGGNRDSWEDLQDSGENKNKVVMFYVRLDGQMPNEPGDFPTNEYTSGVKAQLSNNIDSNEVDNPLKYWMHIYGAGNEAAVRANLNYVPSDAAILAALKKINKDKVDEGIVSVGRPGGGTESVNFKDMSLRDYQSQYYVSWYVSKDQNEWWHIDGTLLKRNAWQLKYDGNGVTDPSTIIGGLSYPYKENNGSATVMNTRDSADNQLLTEPVKRGYKFLGWSTVLDDTENKAKKAAGEPTGETWFEAGDTITVDKEGYIWKKSENTGLEKTSLRATEDSVTHVKEVLLHAQWEKITHDYTIEKGWADDDNLAIKPFVKSVTLNIQRYTTTVNSNGKEIQGVDGKPKAPEVVKEEMKLSSSNEWRNTISLDETDEKGNPYTYTIAETNIGGENNEEIKGLLDSYNLDLEKDRFDPERYVLDYEKTIKIYTVQNVLDTNKTVKITVQKTDETGTKMLEGAVFKLTKTGDTSSGDIEIKDDYTSNGNGIAIENVVLTEGTYELQEMAAPSGYVLDSNPISFKVKNNGTTETPSMVIELTSAGSTTSGWKFDFDSESKTGTFMMHDKEAKMSIKVKKVSDQNISGTQDNPEGLGAAKFVVSRTIGGVTTYFRPSNSENPWANSIDGADKFTTGDGENGTTLGIADISDLPVGKYELREIEAPNGYNLQGVPVKFEIAVKENENSLELVDWQSENAISNDLWDKFKDKDTTITVLNTAGIILPETGGPGTTAYTFGGLAMIIAVSLMYGLNMRRKRGKGGMN